MAKLVLSMDGLVLKEIPLSKERTTIGRRPNNDIQIDNMAISGQHAVVVSILNDSFLEDLNSTNGTLVNGQPIKKHFLKNGDDIELGKYKLKYVVDLASTSGSSINQINTDMRHESRRSEAMANTQLSASAPEGLDAIAQPGTVPGSSASGAIKVLSGANAGRELLLSKATTTLGKPGVQVAVISRNPEGYSIAHVEGAQFPSINGKTVDAQPLKLKDRDIIEIAGIKMEFFLKA